MRSLPPLLTFGVLILAGCSSQQFPKHQESVASIHPGAEKSMALLANRQSKEANTELNRALARTPADANLHFLNGLAYRQMSQQSGQAVSELAETGYRLALEFDPNHWLAAWHLGLLQLEQHQYAEARKTLAAASRLQPRNPDIQLALAGSAYLASDAPVALWAAENTLKMRPGDAEALRIAALSSAALGMDSGTQAFSEQLRSIRPADTEILADRIEAWKRIYAQAGNTDSTTRTGDAQPAPPTQPTPPPAAPTEPGPLAPGWSSCPQGNDSSSSNWSSSSNSWSSGSSGDATEKLQALPSPCRGVPLPRMAVVDVTLIRTQETTGYSQGMNLLDGLKVVLNGSREYNSSNSPSKTVTRSLGLPQAGITYSLNIFSAGDTIADVIARPSLLALDRTPATFFSGSTVSVAMTGQYGGSLSDKNIGVSLSVTPTFIDNEQLLLSVKGARSFIEPAQFDGFEQAITTSNNIVSTNVIMRFGDTLILSGLREREYVKSKEGVPLLRDIPVLQYLFSTHADFDYAQHVLILITPRKPSTLAETERAAQAYLRTPEPQNELDEVGTDAWGSMRTRRPNLEAIMAKLQLSRYRKEFRTGDLSIRRFAPSPSLERVLQDVKYMLYY